jgi:hypothetical protein
VITYPDYTSTVYNNIYATFLKNLCLYKKQTKPTFDSISMKNITKKAGDVRRGFIDDRIGIILVR